MSRSLTLLIPSALAFLSIVNHNQIAHAQNMSPQQLLALADQQVRSRDYSAAMQTYLRAAAMGNLEAKRQVAVGYIRGVGTNQDVRKGLALMEEVAQTGDAQAHYHLGYFYEKGEFVPRDYARALKEFRVSSQGGVWYSSFKLGVMCELAEGTPHDRAAAVGWFERAASQRGDASASYYADFLSHVPPSRRFNSGDDMANAYMSYLASRYQSLAPSGNADGASFLRRCLATAACANAVWPRK